MKRFARPLAAELFREFGGELVDYIAAAEGRVWFLGRDCDVFAAALRQIFQGVSIATSPGEVAPRVGGEKSSGAGGIMR